MLFFSVLQATYSPEGVLFCVLSCDFKSVKLITDWSMFASLQLTPPLDSSTNKVQYENIDHFIGYRWVHLHSAEQMQERLRFASLLVHIDLGEGGRSTVRRRVQIPKQRLLVTSWESSV